MFVHRFGEFELDAGSGRLFRGKVRVPLSDPQSAILVCLVTRVGQMVPKETLIEAGWQTAAVGDGSLKQAISRLRRALGARTGADMIETVPWRGYRFTARVERAERHEIGSQLDAGLEPYRAFIQGRADLYSLHRDAIVRARAAFEGVLRRHADYAPAHVGLANACALLFEASRIEPACNVEALARAVHHARSATVLAPRSGEAWSTLAFALYLQGETGESAAAAHKAIPLEPDNWLHSLRLAFVSWGEDRIRAARTALALCPGLALAHWLIATVLIARGAFEPALDVLHEGCAAQDGQSTAPGSFPAVGLHLLRGLVLAARGRLDGAAEAFTRELACVDGGQLYARECAANTWYALGAVRLRQRRRADADDAFRSALQVSPAHLYTSAALGRPLPCLDPSDPRTLDAAFASAAGMARAGRHADAAQAYRAAVLNASLPCAGWLLPVEPLIDAGSRPDIWSNVLASVCRRAL